MMIQQGRLSERKNEHDAAVSLNFSDEQFAYLRRTMHCFAVCSEAFTARREATVREAHGAVRILRGTWAGKPEADGAVGFIGNQGLFVEINSFIKPEMESTHEVSHRFMRCPYGESCTHAHGIEELRLPHGEVLPEGMEAGYVGHTHSLDGHHGQLDYKLPQDQQSISTFSGEDAESLGGKTGQLSDLKIRDSPQMAIFVGKIWENGG
ncbi:unnamed protein product [Cladocopium goreaui]|nr:unnamed protein product [Cladocopium goreaui]